MTLTSNVYDTALIFEGGGMRASYTSAVAVVLLEAGIHINFTAGISAGATTGAHYVGRDPIRARRTFVELAGDPKMGGLKTLLKGDGVFDSHYLYERTHRAGGTLPFDAETFMSTEADLLVGAFEIESGEMAWWDKSQMATVDTAMRRVRASSSMPVVMPVVEIDDEYGHGKYLDGAIGPDGGIALPIAQQRGYDKFLVVLSQERDFVKQPYKFEWIYKRVFRKYPAVIDALKYRYKRYNETKEKLFELEKQGKAYLFFPDHMPVSNGERSIPKLRAAHNAGLAQARRELPAIKEFLGLA